MSDHPENDPFGETRSAQEPLAAFEAFRARQQEDESHTEPFPERYMAEPTTVLPSVEAGAEPTLRFDSVQFAGEQPGTPPPGTGQYGGVQAGPGPFDAGRYGAAGGGYSGALTPPPPQAETEAAFEYPAAAPDGPAHGRGKVRSAVVFGGVAVLVVGLGIGVYAATRSGGQPAASTPPTTSATSSPGSSNPKTGKAITERLTVTAVSDDSFTGTTAGGATVSVKIASGTKFGTAARPFTRAQLVPGAVVYVRLRREASGTMVATVIAAGAVDKASAAATPSAGV